jgi:hypothetical protein
MVGVGVLVELWCVYAGALCVPGIMDRKVDEEMWREHTHQRIRDSITASVKKICWMQTFSGEAHLSNCSW